jgi:acetolactate synthase-1/2/3 large subunit
MLRQTLIDLAKEGVECVQAHTEKSAIYMADGYARIAGKPGFCFAQSVGAANMAAGMQDAWLGHSPVIGMTGRKSTGHQHRNAYQEVDHAPMFRPVTKLTAEVEKAADLPRLLRQAWRASMTGTPGPAHLDLAGLMGELIEPGKINEPVAGDPALGKPIPTHRPVAAADDIEHAAKAIRAARRPVIIAGTGATASNAGAEILRLAELLQAPIATTLGARGIIPTRHRLSIGTIGTYGVPTTNETVCEADLAIVVGSLLSDQNTHSWRVPAQGTPVIQIEIDPTEAGRNYRSTLAVIGDPKATLAVLLDALGNEERSRAFADKAAASYRTWYDSMEPARNSNASPIRVERLCAEITRALPDDGILVADTGNSGIWTCTMVDLNSTKQTYLRAAGSLGWAFPAALGAKCAAPDRKVICFTGDGAFYYHLTELETARRRGIPVVVVVNNNSGFGQCWGNLRKQGRSEAEIQDIVVFQNTDFAEIARSFGLTGIRVERAEDLAPAFERALAADHTVVIDVVTDINAVPPQPWAPA